MYKNNTFDWCGWQVKRITGAVCRPFNIFTANSGLSQHRWILQNPFSTSYWWPLTICVCKCFYQRLKRRKAETLECVFLTSMLDILVEGLVALSFRVPGRLRDSLWIVLVWEAPFTGWKANRPHAKSSVWNVLYGAEILIACSVTRLLNFSEPGILICRRERASSRQVTCDTPSSVLCTL